MSDNVRKPCQSDLEQVVGHFLYYLSNEPAKDGISPRFRFYGQLPVQAKMLFPDVPDEVFLEAVRGQFDLIRRQNDILPGTGHDWRSAT